MATIAADPVPLVAASLVLGLLALPFGVRGIWHTSKSLVRKVRNKLRRQNLEKI